MKKLYEILKLSLKLLIILQLTLIKIRTNSVNCLITQRIPEYLKECYDKEVYYGQQLPFNLQIFIDIIRKIEDSSQHNMNLRALTSTLVHRFKFDGVEHHKDIDFRPGISPFSGTGSQRAKNELINELISGDAIIFLNESLTLLERCSLHRALSNTVIEAESQETDKNCVQTTIEKISDNPPKKMHSCPTERGVILTPVGTLAPGPIVAAIAAALQPQNVPIKLLLNDKKPRNFMPNLNSTFNENSFDKDIFNEEEEVDFIIPRSEMSLNKSMWLSNLLSSNAEVDNVWFATISGELAELVNYQGPRYASKMTLGSAGFWNSTMRPQIFYLIQKEDDYDMTRAEIVGAVDGFIIAKNLKSWLDHIDNLRLSQILDMYYSNRGIIYNSIGACRRGRDFWYVAPRTIMEEQVYAASQVLAYRKSYVYMTEDALKTVINNAINKFSDYVNNHLFPELHCLKETHYPRVEALLIFDGAWSQEYTADFISVLLEDLNVGKFGSKVGFLHGTTGEILLNMTESPSTIHEKLILQLNSLTWPTYLNYTKILNKTNEFLSKIWKERRQNHVVGSLSQVIIFLVPQGLNTNEPEVITALEQFKENHPDINLLYYTTEQHSASFKQLLLSEEDILIDSSKIIDISVRLLSSSRSLRPALCNFNSSKGVRDQIEDYVKPQETILYKLDGHWRRKTKKVSLKVVSFAYGIFEICKWSQLRNHVTRNKVSCREISGHSELEITDFFDCQKNPLCPAIYYQIRGISSLKKCAETDCKSPEYIRYILRLENLQCSAADISTINLFIAFILFIYYNYEFFY